MLSLGKLRICVVYPGVRMKNPDLYTLALKTSNYISKERFLEDLQILMNDILQADGYTLIKLQDILQHFLKRNRFLGDSDVEQIRKSTSQQTM